MSEFERTNVCTWDLCWFQWFEVKIAAVRWNEMAKVWPIFLLLFSILFFVHFLLLFLFYFFIILFSSFCLFFILVSFCLISILNFSCSLFFSFYFILFYYIFFISFCYLKRNQMKNMMAEGWHIFIFSYIHIYHSSHMKGHEASITFHQAIWH